MERAEGRRQWTVEPMELGAGIQDVRRRPVGPVELRIVGQRLRRRRQMEPVAGGAVDRGAETRPVESVELHTDHGQTEPVEFRADRAAAVVQRQPSVRQVQPE